MGHVIITGQVKPDDRVPGCLFIVRQWGEGYKCILISPYSAEIVVENAEPLTSAEVFKWIEDHKNY